MQPSTPYDHSIYTIEASSIQARRLFNILDESGTEILWARLAGFMGELKIRVYSDKSTWTEILKIDTPKLFGPMAEMYDYPIIDSIGGSRIGTVRLPKGRWKLKPSEKMSARQQPTMDDWILLDHNHKIAGYFKHFSRSNEKGKHNIWDVYQDDNRVCQVHEVVEGNFRTHLKLTADCSFDTHGRMDRRLALSSILVQMGGRIEMRNMG